MMSEAPQYARYAIIEHVVHLVNRDYEAMCKDYYTLEVWPCLDQVMCAKLYLILFTLTFLPCCFCT